MKISSIRSQILVLPEADPLADTPENPNAARRIVIVRIGTDDLGRRGIAEQSELGLHLAEAFFLKLCCRGHGGRAHASRARGSHVIPEIHAHLVAAAPNGLTVEYMGWMLKLFDGVAEFDPAAGELALSDRPGLGLTFRGDTIRQYGVAS